MKFLKLKYVSLSNAVLTKEIIVHIKTTIAPFNVTKNVFEFISGDQ